MIQNALYTHIYVQTALVIILPTFKNTRINKYHRMISEGFSPEVCVVVTIIGSAATCEMRDAILASTCGKYTFAHTLSSFHSPSK